MPSETRRWYAWTSSDSVLMAGGAGESDEARGTGVRFLASELVSVAGSDVGVGASTLRGTDCAGAGGSGTRTASVVLGRNNAPLCAALARSRSADLSRRGSLRLGCVCGSDTRRGSLPGAGAPVDSRRVRSRGISCTTLRIIRSACANFSGESPDECISSVRCSTSFPSLRGQQKRRTLR